jgi:hypothetical protein
MSVIKSTVSEIFHLFVDDGALALSAFALVIAAIVAVKVAHINGLLIGVVFLVGCLVILGASLLRAAQAASRKGGG